MKYIYLDHAAATPIDARVRKACEPFLRLEYGNPSSLHRKGRAARTALEEARARVASVLDVRPREIFFTSGATESNNLAIQGIAHQYRGKGRHIIISGIEHPSIDEAADMLSRDGFSITRVGVDSSGLVDVKAVMAAITVQTILVSIMYANNEVGTIQPIVEIGKALRKWRVAHDGTGPFFHTDASQAAGYLDVQAHRLGVDLMTISGGKIYGPKGSGVLYVRDGVTLIPLLYGGGQERGVRSGTENVAGAVGISFALEIAQKMATKESRRLISLRDYMVKKLLKIKGVCYNGDAFKRLPNNVHVSIAGIDGEAAVIYLDAKGVAASTGSACTSTKKESSRVLAAMGLPEDMISRALRFSLGRGTSRRDVDMVIGILQRIVDKLS